MTKKVRSQFNVHVQKTPVQKEFVSENRTIPQNVSNSWYKAKPSWRFFMMDDEYEKWSPTKNGLLQEKNLQKLKNFERQSWSEILGRNSHEVDPINFCKEAINRLKEIKIDQDSFVSIRFEGKTRLYGYVISGVYHIIWFDPEHEIYPSHKKHT